MGKPTADRVLVNIGQLLTMDPASGGPGDEAHDPVAGLGLILDGAVAFLEDRVVWAGRERDLETSVELGPGHARVDLGGRVVMPGLVDCHTHLVFAGSRAHEFARRVGGASYEEILAAGGGIHATVMATREASTEQLMALGLRRLDRFLSFGVTTVEAKSGYGLETEAELKILRVAQALHEAHPVDVVPTFLGAHVVPREHRQDRAVYLDLVCQEMLPRVAEEGLARFCDVFCDAGAFDLAEARRVLEAGRALGLRPKLHGEQLARTGAIELAVELGAVSVDHLERADESAALALAGSGTVGVLLPGATYFLGRDDYADGRRLADSGCRLAVSTDFNPGSCLTENLPLMLNMAALKNRLFPREVLIGATRFAAEALGLGEEVGSLAPGRLADVLVLDTPDYRNLIYHYGVNHTHQVYKRGRLVWPRTAQG
jgi:imidazolonepropionase